MISPTEMLPVIVLLLTLASLVAVLFQRVRVPYTIALVLVGILLDVLGLVSPTTLSPSLFLSLLLPPLLFEAAFALRWEMLAPVASVVAILATVGVVLSAGVTGGVFFFGGWLPGPLALLFGAVVAATDPVAVVAFFRRARVSSTLRALVEGESLLNDGTAVVLVGLLAGFAVGGRLNLVGGVIDFVEVGLGGLLIGAIVGLAGSALARGTSDYLVEATVSVAIAYGSYLVGEELQVSGVLAVVGAGSVFGNFGRRFGLSAQTEEAIDLLWRFLAFVANSLVFLLLGTAVVPGALLRFGPLIAIGIGATLLGRAAVAYGLGTVLSALSRGSLPFPWRHVLFWGGLRGALPVVVAIAVTDQLGLPALFQGLVLDVVVGTLLIQGLTLEPALTYFLRKADQNSSPASGNEAGSRGTSG